MQGNRSIFNYALVCFVCGLQTHQAVKYLPTPSRVTFHQVEDGSTQRREDGRREPGCPSWHSLASPVPTNGANRACAESWAGSGRPSDFPAGWGSSPPGCLPFIRTLFPFLSTLLLPRWLLWVFQACPGARRALAWHRGDEAFPFPKQRSKQARPLSPGRTLCFHFPPFNLL